jgi:hypothetical protein
MASDFLIAGFWTAHPMFTAMLSALLVVLLSVAVIEVVLAGRAERRWRLLAQSARLASPAGRIMDAALARPTAAVQL